MLALLLIAIVYGAWRLADLKPIFEGTLGESGMLLMIIGMSLLYSYVMSYLHISQGAADWIVGLHLSKWVLLAAILLLVVVLGFFLPPVSIILMTAPIILPPLRAAGFDLDLVRRGHGGGDGNGADPSAGRAEHLRHQPDRPGYRAGADHLGHAAVRVADGGCGGGAIGLSGDRHGASELGLWHRGAVNHDTKQSTICINDNVPLLPFDLLPYVIEIGYLLIPPPKRRPEAG